MKKMPLKIDKSILNVLIIYLFYLFNKHRQYIIVAKQGYH